ncbi:hypothetical protein VFPPC_17996 [Pochonia chlamydosporia 170]|uniref:Uncharacterized protein n=1 Tax=Pochonia chlamydosporia 170 TaxID=1380566 RepID=A0A219APV9_METCM|nr:hypothetical protein VFPPC_17996 [Pochonia chlamydosporia 170]OWT42741.1 hypothetical protein VFPPC_17996 [Pochonia chlamydosporia 170]
MGRSDLTIPYRSAEQRRIHSRYRTWSSTIGRSPGAKTCSCIRILYPMQNPLVSVRRKMRIRVCQVTANSCQKIIRDYLGLTPVNTSYGSSCGVRNFVYIVQLYG